METYLYRLSFKGPVHFGMEGIGLEAVEDHLSSDSLTSALINAAAILHGPDEASRMVAALEANPPAFVLSSLFPYGPDPANNKKLVEALIKPLLDPPMNNHVASLHKEWKRMRYLHPEDFLLCLGKKSMDTSGMEALVERSRELTKKWWQEDIRPRVALDREGRGSSIWNQAAVFFSREERDEMGQVQRWGSGLYGLIRFQDADWRKFLEGAFHLLGETGLGGERTYGLGLFRFLGFEPPGEIWERILKARQERHILLSVFYPREGERKLIGDSFEAWEIRERRGYIVTGKKATTVKRRTMRVIAEGSVCQKSFQGALVDVTPENPKVLGLRHKIVRSGLAFFVPFGGDT